MSRHHIVVQYLVFYGLYNYENKSKLHRKWLLISQEQDIRVLYLRFQTDKRT